MHVQLLEILMLMFDFQEAAKKSRDHISLILPENNHLYILQTNAQSLT